jgi:hypothetical protein
MTAPIANTPGVKGRQMFCVVKIAQDGSTARLLEPSGYQFDVRRTLPQFGGGTVTLQMGQVISAVLHGQSAIGDVLVENEELKERREFDNAPDETVGWTPGVATGEGFEKR